MSFWIKYQCNEIKYKHNIMECWLLTVCECGYVISYDYLYYFSIMVFSIMCLYNCMVRVYVNLYIMFISWVLAKNIFLILYGSMQWIVIFGMRYVLRCCWKIILYFIPGSNDFSGGRHDKYKICLIVVVLYWNLYLK